MNLKTILLLAAAIVGLLSCTKRKPEEIDYAPNSPFNPYPPDSATNVEHTTLDVTLRWTASDPNVGDILTYTIYMDTLNPPLVKIASELSTTSYFLTGLSYNTTYYWNLYAVDDKGVTTSGPVWRFTTLPHANSAPNAPVYLYPSNGTSWLYPTLSLGWNCTDPEESSDTLHYDLCLGTTMDPPVRLFGNDLSRSREITGLNYATTYFWKVVVHDNHGAYAEGPLYSFITRDSPWFYKKEMPSPRYGFGTAVVNNKIYVIGGTDGINYMSEVLEYDPATDTWTRKADMPTPRSDLAVAAWNGKIYALGGHSSLAIYDKNEAYDPSSDTWTVLTHLYQPNYSVTAQSVNGKIYIIGGDFRFGSIIGGVFEYDIAADAWWDSFSVYYDTVWTDSTYTAYDSIIIDTINYYAKSFMPVYRTSFSSVLQNEDIYVVGGAPLNSYPTSAVDIYHPESNSWTTTAPMNGPANFPAAVTANGFVYVLGGYENDYLRRVRKYDPLSDTWFVRGDMLSYRSCFGAACVNNRIYAIGGVTLLPLSTVEEYQIELDPKR